MVNKVPFPSTGEPRHYHIKGWSITTVRAPIYSSPEIDAATAKLKIPMPEMIFGNNYVEIAYSPSSKSHILENSSSSNSDSNPCWKLRFDTLSALDLVDKTGSSNGGLLQVAHSKAWQKSSEKTKLECPDEILGIVKPYDWTYSTNYKGDEILPKSSPTPPKDLSESVPATKGLTVVDKDNSAPGNYEKYAIPFHKLQTREPILFFDEVMLYEDELGDNGIVAYTVKIRVMKERLYILTRMFLRVDGVVFRVRDTRVYVEFKSDITESQDATNGDQKFKKTKRPLVIREYTEKEGSYDSVRSKVPRTARDYSTYLRDDNWISQHIPVTKTVREYLTDLPPYNS